VKNRRHSSSEFSEQPPTFMKVFGRPISLIAMEGYQMSKYKVRVKVELVECSDAEQPEPAMNEDGSFAMTISEKDAVSIDNCENAILRTAHPTIRAAISKHLSEMSKKKSLK